ncbi:hypothetical protein ACH6CV_09785 [Bacillota bacterium Meth-B3]|nr:hypothetical protein [Christensenellaceae bacterium]MEA5065262.1 hypothetical protein [Eubacteriales bacterium]MEA5068700.1 hypothetical protein [Christensenellaceae bacterium]
MGLRFKVGKDAQNAGGPMLFGRKFGNCDQDILARTFYHKL